MAKSVIASALVFVLVVGCAAQRSVAQTADELAQPPSMTRSGVLEATPGFVGSELGIEVEQVEAVDDGLWAIDLSLPFSAQQIDRIQIEAANGKVIELPRAVEIESGSDPNYTDVRVYLPRRKNLEFRVRLIDLPDNQ